MVNVSSTYLLLNEGILPSLSRVSSMGAMKTLASSGPWRLCRPVRPSNWISWSLVAAFRRLTRSTLLKLKWCVSLKQLLLKALSASIWMGSSRGTLFNNEVTSHDTRISPFWFLVREFRSQTQRCQVLRAGRMTTAFIFCPSAVSRKFGFIAHSRGTAETCHVVIFDY